MPAPADVTPFYQTTAFLNTAIFIGLVLASGFIGHWLGKGLRVADYGWKFGVILFAILASTVVILRGWPPRLGIDLGGGSILVYKVDERLTDWRPDKMDALVIAISKRINPGGQKEMSVRSLGNNMVQITMPTVSGSTKEQKQAESEKVKTLIHTTGALQFRIVATKRDDDSLIEKAKAERLKYPPLPITPITVSEGRKKATWCRVRDQELSSVRGDDAAMMVGTTKVLDEASGKEVDKEVWDLLVLEPESDNYNVTGADIRDAQIGINQRDGSPEVEFSFNPAGGVKFGRLTGEHMIPGSDFRYRLAIVMDNELQTAPTLQAAITDRGVITGNFTQEKVKEYVDIINAGSLPAALEPDPVRDMYTEATLGAETIRQSTFAMIIAAIAVPLFMLVYYRFAGLVAVLVLSLNMLMLVALMILIKAPFTLPALAGLALTVGMAVDNNVLIYERLREEISHGAALRMAIRNSFHRVGVVIIDANITHLIAATVLWSVGTEQIKGFAVTFWLGAILSIWATMFVARVMFEVSERRRWIQRLSMMQWIGHTKIDFMAWFPACATFSVVITVLGIVISVVRGQGLFDIDFTGGVSVQAAFQDGQDIDVIRKQIDAVKDLLPDATVTPAHSRDEPDNQRFIIDTSNSDRDVVEAELKKLWDKKLVTMGLTAATIVSENPPAKSEEKKPEKAAQPAGTLPAEKNLIGPEGKPSEPPVDKSAKPAEARPAAPSRQSRPSRQRLCRSHPAGRAPSQQGQFRNRPNRRKQQTGGDEQTGGDDARSTKPKQSRSDLPALEPGGDGRKRSRPAGPG